MRVTYVVHIVAGSLGLLLGYGALYSRKGGPLHRRVGMAFVYAMLAMCAAGFTIAAVRGVAPAVNIPAALLTAYLVVTSLTTVRPPAARAARWLLVGGLLLALGVSLTDFTFAFEAFAGGGSRNGIPAFPFVMFAVVGALASAGDVRVLRAGMPRGAARLARHLWRMCFALFIAALSFFIGQAQVIPEAVRIPGLLALPVAAVLLTMFYWLWRIRVRRAAGLRGIVTVSAREAV